MKRKVHLVLNILLVAAFVFAAIAIIPSIKDAKDLLTQDFETVSSTTSTVLTKDSFPKYIPKGYEVDGVVMEFRETDDGHRIDGKKITGITDKKYLVVVVGDEATIYPPSN